MELIPSVCDGFRAGGAVTLVTAPAAEPDDEPGERGLLMRVLLLVGFSFEGAVERDREIQLVRGDDLAGAARKAQMRGVLDR